MVFGLVMVALIVAVLAIGSWNDRRKRPADGDLSKRGTWK